MTNVYKKIKEFQVLVLYLHLLKVGLGLSVKNPYIVK